MSVAAKPSQMLWNWWRSPHSLLSCIFPELLPLPYNVNPEAGRSSVSVWFHSDAAQLTHKSLVSLGERPHAWLTAEEVAKMCYLSAVQPGV